MKMHDMRMQAYSRFVGHMFDRLLSSFIAAVVVVVVNFHWSKCGSATTTHPHPPPHNWTPIIIFGYFWFSAPNSMESWISVRIVLFPLFQHQGSRSSWADAIEMFNIFIASCAPTHVHIVNLFVRGQWPFRFRFNISIFGAIFIRF